MAEGTGERHRSLQTLPKAHLHLHLPAAMRRSAFAEAVSQFFQGDFKQGLLDTLEKKAKEAQEKSDSIEETKCRRRKAWLEAGCPYPDSLDTSDIARFDRETPKDFHKDASLVWDIQFAAKVLLEDLPGDASAQLIRQTVIHLAEDAEQEGVFHAELMTGLKFDPSKQEQTDADTLEKWGMLFSSRQEALAAAPELSLMLVVALPAKCKTENDAKHLVNLLRSVKGYEESAIAGVAYFCGEDKLLKYKPALDQFKQAGFRLVCIHAGEGEPSKGQGPQRVRDALEVGADRIGHGIEAAADETLMKELCQKSVCLEVCPCSNRALGCCPAVTSQVPPLDSVKEGLAQHPLPRLLDAGVECALSADDPLYWAAPDDGAHGLVREFRACRELMGLDDAALARLADASFVHSSAPLELKDKARAAIKRWMSEAATPCDEVIRAFRDWDVQGCGKISHSQLRNLLQTFLPDSNDKAINALLAACELNQDDTVDYEQFVNSVFNPG